MLIFSPYSLRLVLLLLLLPRFSRACQGHTRWLRRAARHMQIIQFILQAAIIINAHERTLASSNANSLLPMSQASVVVGRAICARRQGS